MNFFSDDAIREDNVGRIWLFLFLHLQNRPEKAIQSGLFVTGPNCGKETKSRTRIGKK